jgi:predicted alpha/beta-hydrolase family hydrolase
VYGCCKMKHQAEALQITVDRSLSVSGLLLRPPQATVCYVFAHGAGAGMTHAFMESVAGGLCDRGVATLRYQFPYMEKGSRRPDAPAVAHATVRAATAEAGKLFPDMALLAGGKSFGGRMTSQAQASQPLPGVRGLVFFGFPLHPAGKPLVERADHLADVHVPMLFIQGTRDKLAELTLIQRVVKKLGPDASLREIDGADHSLHVPVKSGRRDADVLNEALDAFVLWSGSIVGNNCGPQNP